MTKPKPDWASYGRKGGKARLRTMTKAQRQAVARKGARAAQARWKTLTPEQRQEAVRRAVLARWKKHRASKKKTQHP
jgi:hypothetical protein